MDIFNISIVEFVGYMASLGVLSSFLMSNMTKLRLVNIVGCLFFIAYGFLLNIAWPIVITNAAIVFINLYHLLKKD